MDSCSMDICYSSTPTQASPPSPSPFAFHPPPLSPRTTLTPATPPTFPASHFASLPACTLTPLASPALPLAADICLLLPPLRSPLLGTLIDARHQVLLLASHALTPAPTQMHMGMETDSETETEAQAGNVNRHLYSHLALSCQEALERVNEWLRESDVQGGWGTGSQAEETRAGVVRLLDLELFLIRQHVTAQTSLTAPTVQRLWAFYDTLRHLSSRTIPPSSSCAAPALALQLLQNLPAQTVLHPSSTPTSTIRALLHACLLDPALLSLARERQLGVDVRGWEGEQPEDVEMALRKLDLGALVSGGKKGAKGLGEGWGRRELATPVSPVMPVFSS
ncbi:hypothetical protein CALVIDRAFT_599445 [Calocera viscosa TUFC12733]|uniref:Uncharacterized protein n=1 Tax=Calocera viscosa (strain TUFC12733) TaxID=1330018 RepID=A0A167KST6_CALVF|nr:hypothetical protein CALVIDRAFT_599445 [Calocera viscosa TUFC12733]